MFLAIRFGLLFAALFEEEGGVGLYIRFDCVTETAVEKYDETSREGGQEWSWCQQDSRPALTLTETNFYFISFLFHKNRREIERGKTIDWLDRHTL